MSHKHNRFQLRRAANLLTTRGKVIDDVKDMITEEPEHEQHRQSLLRRHSSNLGNKWKKWINRRSATLPPPDPAVEVSESVVEAEEAKRQSWMRRTSISWRRSLSTPTPALEHASHSDLPPLSSFPSQPEAPTSSWSMSESVEPPEDDVSQRAGIGTAPAEAETVDESWTDAHVSAILQSGVVLTKMSAKKHAPYIFRIDPHQSLITYKNKSIPIESIKEIRTGTSAEQHLHQFGLPLSHLPLWITVIYVCQPGIGVQPKHSSASTYKTLHLLAPSLQIHDLWETTLRALLTVRLRLLSSDPTLNTLRTDIWERSYFMRADSLVRDSKLDFSEVEKLLGKLNVTLGVGELRRLFLQADKAGRGYLDFDAFKVFVRLLKGRKDLDRLFNRLVDKYGKVEDGLGFDGWKAFMMNTQKSTLSQGRLREVFEIYSSPVNSSSSDTLNIPSTPGAISSSETNGNASNATSPTLPTPPPSSSPSPNVYNSDLPSDTERWMSCAQFTTFLTSSDNPPLLDTPPAALPPNHHLHFPHLHRKDEHHSHSHNSHNASLPLTEISHDMTRPLSEYFISSSHNTYLVGNQLVGLSTVEGYIRALLSGCRSVEVDVYPPPSSFPSSEPVIFHGHTLTSKVSLREVCEAINNYGWITSEYPIIISAEVHCDASGQKDIARIMRSVFGWRLVERESEMRRKGLINSVEGEERQKELGEFGGLEEISWKIEELPSPEDLKGRVMLKTKNLILVHQKSQSTASHPIAESSTSDIDSHTDSGKHKHKRQGSDGGGGLSDRARSVLERVKSGRKASSGGEGSTPPAPTIALPQSTPPLTSSPLPIPTTPPYLSSGTLTLSPAPSTPPSSFLSRRLSASTPKSKAEKVKEKMSPDLLPLLVYTVGVKCRGLNKKEVYGVEEMFSLSEGRANKMLLPIAAPIAETGGFGGHEKGEKGELIKHTRTHLVRIYPKGMRLRSTNYVPVRYWGGGCQLVAINWQTFDIGYMINMAMFQRNGKTGYVLKPVHLRFPSKHFHPHLPHIHHHSDPPSTLFQVDPPIHAYLDITIISAQHLQVPNPYVEVCIYTPDISEPEKYRTSVVKNNGFSPVWEERLSIPFTLPFPASSHGEIGNHGELDLIFVKLAVHEEGREEEEAAVFIASLGCLQRGYRHLPLCDRQMAQSLFERLFVKVGIST